MLLSSLIDATPDPPDFDVDDAYAELMRDDKDVYFRALLFAPRRLISIIDYAVD